MNQQFEALVPGGICIIVFCGGPELHAVPDRKPAAMEAKSLTWAHGVCVPQESASKNDCVMPKSAALTIELPEKMRQL